MWQTIYNWPWAIIWAAISAVFTATTAGVACWALFRWRKQDELKAKLAFKHAVCNYAYALAQLPETIQDTHPKSHLSKQLADLTDLFSACSFAWFAAEGLMDKNVKVKTAWDFMIDNHRRYLDGQLEANRIGECCAKILREKFIFI
ncbi:hypothetical protein ACR9GP_05920 [Enterobacter ludwigii]